MRERDGHAHALATAKPHTVEQLKTEARERGLQLDQWALWTAAARSILSSDRTNYLQAHAASRRRFARALRADALRSWRRERARRRLYASLLYRRATATWLPRCYC